MFARLVLFAVLAAVPSSAQETLTASTVAASAEPAPASTAPAVELFVRWPEEGAKLAHLRRSFTFGSVTPGSSLTLNGFAILPRPSGAFFGMVEFATGSYALDFEARLGDASTRVVRSVFVAPEKPDLGEGLVFVEPAADLELLPGDIVPVRLWGPPGGEGSFDVKRLTKRQPLVERPPGSGLYEGHYRVRPGDEGEGRALTAVVRAPGGDKRKGEAPGKLTVLEGERLRVALSTAPHTVLKSAKQGWSLFFPPGIQFTVTGRAGGLYRVALAPDHEGWVDADKVALLPDGTPPSLAQVGKYLSTAAGTDSVRITLGVDRPVPFELRHTIEPFALQVRFFGAAHRFDRFRFDPKDALVRELRWRQEDASTVLLEVDTPLAWGWGYDARYDGGRFVLELRRPPRLAPGRSVLAGRRIALDPGHAPDRGAIGPLGTEERHVNLAIALKLKELLEAEGASVFLVRDSTGTGPPLQARPGLAWGARAEVLVSVHNNALGDIEDPFSEPRGYMTFYHHPMSRPLAEHVHRSYRGRVPELADEALRWGDLHVCRTTQMPAILTESAYLIFPEQEELLRDPPWQERFATAMLDGLRSWLEAYRQLQLASPAEQAAASSAP